MDREIQKTKSYNPLEKHNLKLIQVGYKSEWCMLKGNDRQTRIFPVKNSIYYGKERKLKKIEKNIVR